MSPQTAVEFARELMREYGLQGWRVALDGAVRRFGACRYRDKSITLSARLVQLNSEAQVLDTILHEIAHALAGPGKGHGAEWARIARSIGCSASRCYSAQDTQQPAPRYLLRCGNCGHTTTRYRLKGRASACLACCNRFAGGRFDERFLLTCVPTGIAST